ncbi:electroneutral sodium bicarbonate exchanger 1-like isoform X2 [Leptinotarsa decemlineata]|uniref:electroneutral sodium bicarbonate exchanger 1-like isoform X2 n=1 Tax=Leptinotarsa decemlineata TaxID=7539 RepID=UPI003D308EF8
MDKNGFIEDTSPAQRLRCFFIEENIKHESHPLFSEIEKLVIEGDDVKWKETARWIKFEEDVEEGNRWSKPYVASLSLKSLFELRRLIAKEIVILDMEASSMEQIADLVLEDTNNNKILSLEQKGKIRETLLKGHRHQYQQGFPFKGSLNGKNGSSLVCFGTSSERRESEYEMDLAKKKCSSNSINGFRNREDNNQRKNNQRKYKSNMSFMRKIPPGAEATNILVGEVNFLDKPISAFIRLNTGVILDNLTEVPLPTRFLFILIGPYSATAGYDEIGRAMATLMSDDVFSEVAYGAHEKDHLLMGLDEFLSAVIVLPPGEWDPAIRIEPPANIPSQEFRKRPPEEHNGIIDEIEEKEKLREETGLARTGILFGGLKNDLKRKAPWYWSDFRDALALQSVASWIFLYFACLSPIITFGGLLSEATGRHMAAMESLVSGCICGIFYGFFSGQPLTILGSTGPVLVFETIVYDFCHTMDWDYLSFRFWIGTWIAVILLILVAIDASAFVCYITRFTEENFATLVALIFIYKAFENVMAIGKKYPIGISGTDCLCFINDNVSTTFSNTFENISRRTQCLELNSTFSERCLTSKSTSNVFLMSILLFFGTFIISIKLKDFKNASFFSTKIRLFISDFSVLIAILIMTILDFNVSIPTPKLEVPYEFKPTLPNRGWIVPPFKKNPYYAIPLAIAPALLGTILIFMDQQITVVIVNRKEFKLRKGCGYHLDLFVLSILIEICSIFGLPWFVAATVLSITHVHSLKQESECTAPGDKPKFLGVREQRVTHIMIFFTIGLSVFLTPVLGHIPLPVLFGVFLYMGISSLKGLEFFDRILIMFMSNKYQPDYMFLRKVPLKRVHLFTIIQLACLISLWVVQSFSQISILFPVMLVVMIVIRKFLDCIFTRQELQILDDLMPERSNKRRLANDNLPIGFCARFSRLILGPKLVIEKNDTCKRILKEPRS